MEEIWKKIKGYEEYYEVSNLGRIRSLDRLRWNGRGYQKQLGAIKRQTVNNMGYYVVGLSKDGKNTLFLVHRIIAEAFIPNPKNLPLVNHIDGNKLNITLENLEWSTHAKNNAHAIESGLNIVKKKIKGIHTKTNEIVYFESAREADRVLKIGYKNISACLTGRQHTAGGYKWEFVK